MKGMTNLVRIVLSMAIAGALTGVMIAVEEMRANG
jgi:ABC-type phosphate transport system permease subunit